MVSPDSDTDLAIVVSGPVVAEAREAHNEIIKEHPGAGLLVVTSPDQLYNGWAQRSSASVSDHSSHVSRLLSPLSSTARLVTVLDGHPGALSWLGSVKGHKLVPLGVDRFGQSGDIPDLYRAYELDDEAIVGAVSEA